MCCRFELDDTLERPRSGRRSLRSVAAIGGAAMAAIAIAAAAIVAGAAEPTQELTLVARDMAFYLPQGGEPNPPLEVGREEEVRLTLVNRDRGIDHDFAVASLGVETEAIPGDGGSTTVEFRAPGQAGVHQYVCRLHGKMMRGRLTVR